MIEEAIRRDLGLDDLAEIRAKTTPRAERAVLDPGVLVSALITRSRSGSVPARIPACLEVVEDAITRLAETGDEELLRGVWRDPRGRGTGG